MAQSRKKLSDLIKKHSKGVKKFKAGDFIEGKIVSIDRRYLLVDVGAKSEGLISKDEIKFLSSEFKNIKMGDVVRALVVQPENRQGNLILSLKEATAEKTWDDLEELYKNGGTIKVEVLDYYKGGLIVDISGQRGFIPISHLTREHFEQFNVAMVKSSGSPSKTDLGGLKGKNLKVKVIEVDSNKNRLVLSEKEVMSKEEVEAREKRLAKIKVGDLVKGNVSTVLPYGVLVDLNGVDGLIHISEIAWEKISSPSDYFSPGDEVEAKIISKEDDKIALSVKELKDNPWDNVEKKYPLGKKIKAKVSKVVAFGVFIELEPGLDGLIHSSEMEKPLAVGDEVEAVVVNANSKERKLAFSVRQIEDSKIYR